MIFPEDYFLNFHAHQQLPADKEIIIQSKFLQEDLIANSGDKIFFTSGLHPWHADVLDLKDIESRLVDLLNQNKIFAVGEIGIDKLKGPSMDIQMEVLNLQLDIAKDFNMPVIIHSVKAHNEILKFRLDKNQKEPWVIHHFNGSKQMALDLIDHGFYLSLSHHIQNTQSRLSKYLKNLPLERIFLETDDFDVDIKSLYKTAAEAYQVSEEKLKKQIMLNAKRFFNVQ